jgi:hypothetical protein
MMEEEWTTRMKAKEKGGSSGGDSSRGAGDCGHGRVRGRGRGGGRNVDASLYSCKDTMARDACYNHGKVDHFARECRSKKKSGEAHAAQEEEATLLLATCGAFQTLLPPPPPLQISVESNALSGPRMEDGLVWSHSVKGARSVGEAVHLVEEKVYAHLSNKEDKD